MIKPATFGNWCDAIFVINLAKRHDRWEEAKEELRKMEVGAVCLGGRFEAYANLTDHNGRPNGNFGCTSSHRALLEIIAFHKYERALILEDDFMVRTAIAGQLHQLFDEIVSELPENWRMLYLGGSYGEAPKRRHSRHLIETNAVMTTSSYVINWRQARRMAPHISGIGPIDSLYHRFNREGGCFMAYPRLFVQRPSFSDLTERMAENVTSMEDEAHEDMLLEGTWLTRLPEGDAKADILGTFQGTVQRREISDPSQMRGTQVIVDGRLYVIHHVELPAHFPPSPWFRGEPCTYHLRLP